MNKLNKYETSIMSKLDIGLLYLISNFDTYFKLIYFENDCAPIIFEFFQYTQS